MKRGQSEVISVVLIILIAIVSVVILWNVVDPLIRNKSGEIDISKVTTNLNIKEAILFINGASKVTIQRNMGSGEITSLKFVFYDSNGNSHVETKEGETLKEFETKTYSFGPIPLEEVASISVVPYFQKNAGMEFKSTSKSMMRVPASLVSWWEFKSNSQDSAGANSCGEVTLADDANRGKAAKFESVPTKCGKDASLNMGDDLGLSFWIKTSSDGNLIRKGDNYAASVQDGKLVFRYKGAERICNSVVSDGAWHHVAISMLSTYIDGEPDCLGAISGSASINTDEIEIGGFNGYLSEVMIFNSSLSSEQAYAIYNQEKA
jgi:hypothetical protein